MYECTTATGRLKSSKLTDQMRRLRRSGKRGCRNKIKRSYFQVRNQAFETFFRRSQAPQEFYGSGERDKTIAGTRLLRPSQFVCAPGSKARRKPKKEKQTTTTFLCLPTYLFTSSTIVLSKRNGMFVILCRYIYFYGII